MEDNTWKSLTDPVLLVVFSYLDVRELNIASRTCKNWYRVAQDESLWKCLTFRRLGCRYSRTNTLDWKSELKRLMYHVPALLHQTCEGHVGEMYEYVCFSNSGQLLATCGADGIVALWRYGHDTTWMHSQQIADVPSYVDYVEFNKAETHLLVHCMGMGDERFNAIAILSIEKGTIQIVAARRCGMPELRATWLTNNTFLTTDTTDMCSPDDLELTACKIIDQDLDESESSMKVRIPNFLSKENLDENVLLQIERNSFFPNFVKVIDWSEWNQDVSNGQQRSTSTNEKVVALYLQNIDFEKESKIVFYKLNLDSPYPVAAQPIKTILIHCECFGAQLSADHRCLVYNLRQFSTDSVWHKKEVVTMVINLTKIEEEPAVFEDKKVGGRSSSILSYFFPSASTDLVANKSDRCDVQLWDRHSRQMISKLSQELPDTPDQNGVSAIAFHPQDQEVIASVSEDNKLRMWMSTNRQRKSALKL